MKISLHLKFVIRYFEHWRLWGGAAILDETMTPNKLRNETHPKFIDKNEEQQHFGESVRIWHPPKPHHIPHKSRFYHISLAYLKIQKEQALKSITSIASTLRGTTNIYECCKAGVKVKERSMKSAVYSITQQQTGMRLKRRKLYLLSQANGICWNETRWCLECKALAGKDASSTCDIS